jgi:hypothetical protein
VRWGFKYSFAAFERVLLRAEARAPGMAGLDGFGFFVKRADF